MATFITPVYDRTEQDVVDVVNKINNPKGALSAEFLNRVENNTRYLADMLTSVGYPINITTKTDWSRSSYPYTTEMIRISNNIRAITYGFRKYYDVSTVGNSMNYVTANSWEKSLETVNIDLDAMRNYYIYCGVANCGQNRMWQNRFRRIELSTPIIMNWSRLSSYETWNDLAEDFEKWGDVIV